MARDGKASEGREGAATDAMAVDDAPVEGCPTDLVEAVLVEAFISVEEALERRRGSGGGGGGGGGGVKAKDVSGAVAAVALVMAGVGYQRVWVANCGDVRVVLDDGVSAQTISHDHTLPRSFDVNATDADDSAAEAARVVAAGGRLTLTLDGFRRVMGAEGVLGGLQVTTTFIHSLLK